MSLIAIYLHGACAANAAALQGLNAILLGKCATLCWPKTGVRAGAPVNVAMLHTVVSNLLLFDSLHLFCARVSHQSIWERYTDSLGAEAASCSGVLWIIVQSGACWMRIPTPSLSVLETPPALYTLRLFDIDRGRNTILRLALYGSHKDQVGRHSR